MPIGIMWAQSFLPALLQRLGREDGQDGMEYAVVAAVVIGLVAAAFAVGGPSITKVITDALNAIDSAI